MSVYYLSMRHSQALETCIGKHTKILVFAGLVFYTGNS